jgi:hypothetical protein
MVRRGADEAAPPTRNDPQSRRLAPGPMTDADYRQDKHH